MDQRDATIVTTASSKGGVGKTFLALNLAYYEALRNKKVLLIDLDYQRNDSLLFLNTNKRAVKDSRIYNAFVHDKDNPRKPYPKDFKPAHVAKNIDLFSGSADLNDVDELMTRRKYQSSFVLMNLLVTKHLNSKYDFIICDTHNSFECPTINSLIIADYILTPIIPNYFSIDSVSSMSNRLADLKNRYYNVQTKKSNINAKLCFVGNMVKFNTKASHQFCQVIEKDPTFVAMFRYRELVNKAINNRESVFDYANNSNDKKIIKDEIDPEFKKLDNVISK